MNEAALQTVCLELVNRITSDDFNGLRAFLPRIGPRNMIVRCLLKETTTGNTSIHYATIQNPAILDFLLGFLNAQEKVAVMHNRNNWGDTPWLCALTRPCIDTLEVLTRHTPHGILQSVLTTKDLISDSDVVWRAVASGCANCVHTVCALITNPTVRIESIAGINRFGYNIIQHGLLHNVRQQVFDVIFVRMPEAVNRNAIGYFNPQGQSNLELIFSHTEYNTYMLTYFCERLCRFYDITGFIISENPRRFNALTTVISTEKGTGSFKYLWKLLSPAARKNLASNGNARSQELWSAVITARVFSHQYAAIMFDGLSCGEKLAIITRRLQGQQSLLHAACAKQPGVELLMFFFSCAQRQEEVDFLLTSRDTEGFNTLMVALSADTNCYSERKVQLLLNSARTPAIKQNLISGNDNKYQATCLHAAVIDERPLSTIVLLMNNLDSRTQRSVIRRRDVNGMNPVQLAKNKRNDNVERFLAQYW